MSTNVQEAHDSLGGSSLKDSLRISALSNGVGALVAAVGVLLLATSGVELLGEGDDGRVPQFVTGVVILFISPGAGLFALARLACGRERRWRAVLAAVLTPLALTRTGGYAIEGGLDFGAVVVCFPLLVMLSSAAVLVRRGERRVLLTAGAVVVGLVVLATAL